MKIKRALTLGILVSLLTGCITSINPIYTEKDIIFQKELVGSWADKKSGESWNFEKFDEKYYLLTHRENEEEASFRAVLVKIGNYTFLDLYPNDPSSKNSLEKMHLLPVHTFSKVTLNGNNLTLEMLNPEWLEQGLLNHTIQVQHNKSPEGSLVLTAPTEELQNFMLAHANTKEAFDEPLNLNKN
jgi:hypothetical protein